MRNKKVWLFIKAILILLLTALILGAPTQDSFRKWFRFAMLVVFVISFIVDLNQYRKKQS